MAICLGLSSNLILFLHFCNVLANTNSFGFFKTITSGPKPIWNDTHLDKLKKDLFLNYDRFVRPGNHNETTHLYLGITILHLDIDEAKSVIVVDSQVNLVWSDSKLKWNSSDYEDLIVMKIGDHEVWQPDIYLYNSVSDGEQLSRVENTNVLVYSNGDVLWVPQIKFTALCKLNLRYWPFDTQHCQLKFALRNLNIKQSLYNNNDSVMVENTAKSSPWHIEGIGEVVNDENWTDFRTGVVFHFKLTRKATPYYAILVAPAVSCTMLILVQFLLPPYLEEKIILNGCIVALSNFFLFYFNGQVKAAGVEIPLIVVFYSCCLYLAGISSALSVILYLVSTLEKTNRPFRWIKSVHGRLRALLFLKDQEVDNWTTVAMYIDRLFLLIYAIIFVILAVIFA